MTDEERGKGSALMLLDQELEPLTEGGGGALSTCSRLCFSIKS